MRLRFKPLGEEEKVIEVESTETILSVKQKVAAEFPNYPVSEQRLNYNGKFMKNIWTVEKCSLKDGYLVRIYKSLRTR